MFVNCSALICRYNKGFRNVKVLLFSSPNLLLHVLLLSGEASMVLFACFDCVFSLHQFSVPDSCSLLFLPQGFAQGADALLIMVQLSQLQLQAVLVEFIHKCLVFLGLGKRERGECAFISDSGHPELFFCISAILVPPPCNFIFFKSMLNPSSRG